MAKHLGDNESVLDADDDCDCETCAQVRPTERAKSLKLANP